MISFGWYIDVDIRIGLGTVLFLGNRPEMGSTTLLSALCAVLFAGAGAQYLDREMFVTSEGEGVLIQPFGLGRLYPYALTPRMFEIECLPETKVRVAAWGLW